MKMSIKDLKCDGNHMRIPNNNQSLRISMRNLKLRDSDRGVEHIRGNQPSLLRGQNNQLTDEKVDHVKDH